MTILEPNEYISPSRELFTNAAGVKIEYIGSSANYGSVPVESFAVLTEEESKNLARESTRLRNQP